MGPGLHSTDPLAAQVHGSDPQFLLSSILRERIHSSLYFKSSCFALSAATLINEAVQLSYVANIWGSERRVSPFICLILKMLQIQPKIEIIKKLCEDTEFKYVRVLALFYLRLVGSASDVYTVLEEHGLSDMRKIRLRTLGGWEVMCVDEFVDLLLREVIVLEISLPRIARRVTMEGSGKIKKRKSVLSKDVRVKEAIEYKRRMDEVEKNGGKKKKGDKGEKKEFNGLFKEKIEKGEIEVEVREKKLKVGSDEYWNAERAKLGMKALNKK